MVWRNQGPRVSYICFALGSLSICVAALHHVFSRSQRQAYERVVKLLGVRRLTAGFFDINSGNGPINVAQLENMRHADPNASGMEIQDSEEVKVDTRVDPAKLDPIQAA